MGVYVCACARACVCVCVSEQDRHPGNFLHRVRHSIGGRGPEHVSTCLVLRLTLVAAVFCGGYVAEPNTERQYVTSHTVREG